MLGATLVREAESTRRRSSVVEERGVAMALSPWSSAVTRPSIGIATAWWGSYDVYLDQWQDAVSAQDIQPDEVVVHHVKDHTSHGKARNEAVAQLSTDWVVFVDVDDTLLPNAIADTVPHLHTSDVVVWNYREKGGVDDGQVQTFTRSGSLEALRAVRQASSISPFRRSLWEASPYLEIDKSQRGLDGAIDTYFWIGLSKLDAIFRNIDGVQFIYNRHGDSMVLQQMAGQFDLTNAFAALLARDFAFPPANGYRAMQVAPSVYAEANEIAKALGVKPADLIEVAWQFFKKNRTQVL